MLFEMPLFPFTKIAVVRQLFSTSLVATKYVIFQEERRRRLEDAATKRQREVYKYKHEI